MSSPEEYSRTSPIDASLVDTNGGEVPPDRPHFAFWPRRLSRTLTLPVTSLWNNVEVAARRYPGKAATIYFGRRKDYATLHREAEAIAGWLQAQGVKRGDRVALFMQNCPQYLVAYHAILRADAVVVPVNAMNKAEEFGHYIVDPGTRVVICSAELAAIVASANAALPPSQRVARVLATRYADELPETFEDDLLLGAGVVGEGHDGGDAWNSAWNNPGSSGHYGSFCAHVGGIHAVDCQPTSPRAPRP